MAGRVEIYRRIKGEPLERVIARTAEAQAGLREHTARVANRAVVILAFHKDSGNSFIEVKEGSIDWYVILNDTRGAKAAMSIEFGRTIDSKRGPSEAVAPLRRGTGLL